MSKNKKPPVVITEEMTYAEAAMAKMRSTDNYRGNPLAIQDLADHMHYSSEHIRRVLLRGSTLISEKFNTDLCRALHLDPEMMSKKNLRSRSVYKVRLVDENSDETRMLDIFSKLNVEDRRRVLNIATGLFEQARLAKSAK